MAILLERGRCGERKAFLSCSAPGGREAVSQGHRESSLGILSLHPKGYLWAVSQSQGKAGRFAVLEGKEPSSGLFWTRRCFLSDPVECLSTTSPATLRGVLGGGFLAHKWCKQASLVGTGVGTILKNAPGTQKFCLSKKTTLPAPQVSLLLPAPQACGVLPIGIVSLCLCRCD